MHDRRISLATTDRRGFSLVELLIVLVIIGILMALLLPAIGAARANAQAAQVVSEIADLETALAAFKAKFGMYPPSSITLQPPGGTWDARSRAILRQMFPQFDFASSGGLTTTIVPSAVTLNASECLVFFLGGVRNPATGGLVGFSKHPQHPLATGGSREGPFFEFDPTRLRDNNPTGTPAFDPFPVYIDKLPSQTKPYLYFSAYDGRGYDPAESSPDLTNGVYRTGAAADAPRYNPDSFQLISPGFDREYGSGGFYDSTNPNNTASDITEADRDNITNFRKGMLVP